MINLHIILRAIRIRRHMQPNRLPPKQIRTGGNRARDIKAILPAVGVDIIRRPLPARQQPAVGDFEPAQPRDAGGFGVADFGHVDELGARVRARVPGYVGGAAGCDGADGGGGGGAVDVADLGIRWVVSTLGEG